MRSVPHRVVCLLGLDDGISPARSNPTATTCLVLIRGSATPTREARTASPARRRHGGPGDLVVTYSCCDERSNLRRPPAVPVGELLDVVDTRCEPRRPGCATPSSSSIPCSPSTSATSSANALVPDRPWSFDSIHLAGARAALGPRHQRHPSSDARRNQPSPGPPGSDQLGASCVTPCVPSCASVSTSGSGTGPGTSGRNPHRSRRAGALADRRACCRSNCRVPTAACLDAERRAACCRPDNWPTPN